MFQEKSFLKLFLLSFLFTLLTVFSSPPAITAAQLTLSWSDNSTNEAGFRIERRTGTTGTYAEIATLGVNAASYTDVNLANGTSYCYRVRAYNAGGMSGYSNEQCATTSVATSYPLTVAKSGTGGGVVTATGINCGADCTELYASGTSVTLTAIPAGGSSFAGWSGTGCSTTGTVMVNGNMTCTATFNVNSFTLTVAKNGTGGGVVAATGINCGADCSELYASGTSVTLTAIPAGGSSFAGWSGTGCSTTGTVTVNGNMTCTANFNLVPGFALTVNVAQQVTTGGSASGRVISNPSGIDCGSDCSENYSSGMVINLTPIPATGSVFTGWTGHADCAASVTMNANKSCTANFAQTNAMLTVTKVGSGSVSSTPSGINCGSTCSYSFSMGGAVTLQATPSAGFTFAGWRGSGCQGTAGCTMTVSSSNTAVTATFVSKQADKVGIYRPSTGEWFLDQNGDGCSIDKCVRSLATAGAVPVVGDWNGSGGTRLGLFFPATAQWRLDINSDEILGDCGVDRCLGPFGEGTDIPIAGKWSSAGYDRIGVFRPSNERWYMDVNGNGSLNSCSKDRCASMSVYRDGDLPVTGDWSGDGVTKVGLYRPSTGQWFLDRNGDRSWDGCRRDLCISSFGTVEPEDLPVTGDWNGTGKSKIGLFRPQTGEWLLDLNGNNQWDGCGIDLCLTDFGHVGDIPVAGKW